jgi:hypothetical protein
MGSITRRLIPGMGKRFFLLRKVKTELRANLIPYEFDTRGSGAERKAVLALN